MRKALVLFGTVGVSALSFAQESSVDIQQNLTTYLNTLKGTTTSSVAGIMPILGEIATIGIVVFLAFWAFRAIKRFLGR